MATHLIVYGHGAGDPGAVGNGTNERDFNRKTLHPYLKKWADKSKDSFVFFDTTGSRDMFQETANGWGMYSIKSNQYSSVTELHEDAASASATGGHVIISSSFNPDKEDLNLAQIIKKIVGWWGGVSTTKGISFRNNLLNLNVAAQRGITYRLMELGFITSKRDMDIIKNNLDGYAQGIIEEITGEKLGSGNVSKPIVYQDKTGWYQALRDDKFYQTPDLDPKKDSWWNVVKGQRIWVSKVVKVGKDGKYTRAAISFDGVTRYCTLRDDFWKYLGK